MSEVRDWGVARGHAGGKMEKGTSGDRGSSRNSGPQGGWVGG